MPIETRDVKNLDPRKMFKEFLICKRSSYRYQSRKLENEAKEFNSCAHSNDCNDNTIVMMTEKEYRLVRMNKYLNAMEVRMGP